MAPAGLETHPVSAPELRAPVPERQRHVHASDRSRASEAPRAAVRGGAAARRRPRRGTHATPARTARREGPEPKPRTLLLVGEREEADSVAAVLSDLQVALDWSPTADGLDERERVGVVVVELASGPGRARAAERVGAVRAASALPVFAVVSDESPGARIRRLYAAGASSVFEWPRESLMLGRFLAEMLALTFVRGRAARPDTALARTVRAHLKLLPGLDAPPHVEAHGGVVRAGAELGSLALKREVERCIAGVPGVRALDTRALHVVPEAPVPDARIRRDARRLLDARPEVGPGTVSVSVRNGMLALQGTAESPGERRRIERLVTGIRGVREVDLRLVVSRSRKREDRRAARRLAGAVAAAFPDADVRVAYFGGVAAVSGTAPTLRVRREIHDLVEDDAAVDRVVDKIDVPNGA